jgi:sugar phosphate isomerase/epimerase
MKSALTLSLVAEAKDGPFLFQGSLAEGFALAARFAFDAVEIFPDSAESLDARELKKLTKEQRLQIAAIGSGMGWVRHKLSLTDADPMIRRRAREFIAAILDFAGGFGAPVIVGSMQGRWQGTVSRAQALTWLAEALEQLGPRAHARGVPLLYEFLNRYETNLLNCVADSLDFLKGLRTQNVKLLCDLFHMNIEETDLAAALRAAGAKLGHVHFADSNRRAVGLGHTDMTPVIAALRQIGYDGYLSAEVLPLPNSEAAAAQTIASFQSLNTL